MARIFIIKFTDSRMIPANQSVGTTIVFHDQSMKNRLTWPSEDVGHPQRSQDGSLLRIIGLEHVPIGKNTELVTGVFSFGHFYQRLNKNPIQFFQCRSEERRVGKEG